MTGDPGGSAKGLIMRHIPPGWGQAPSNGLELSCPAEAGSTLPTLRHAAGEQEHLRPSPPGQLQRVVRLRPLRHSTKADR